MTTTSKKSKIGKGERRLTFYTTGAGMTNLIRNSWASDTPKHALKLCRDGMGMSTEQALLVIGGKKKLTGDSRDGGLDWADDNATEHDGISLDFDNMVERLEKKYISIMESINLLNAGAVLAKWELDEDDDSNERSLSYYQEKLAGVLEEIEEMYSIQGKSMKDLPTKKVRSAKQLREQAGYGERYASPRRGSQVSQQSITSKNAEAVIDRISKTHLLDDDDAPEKPVDINAPRHLNMGTGGEYYVVHTPADKCRELNMNSGWLLPDGTFYAGNAAWIHKCILDDLDEMEFFEGKNYTCDEDSVTGEGNWLKLSGGEWFIWEYKNKPTMEQVQFIIDHSIAYDKDVITISSRRIHLQVFAKLLDGVPFESSEFAKESEPIIEAAKIEKQKSGKYFPTVDEVKDIDVLSTVFFQPDEEFMKWLVKYANGRTIVDVGCGSGYLTALILHHKGKAVGIEPQFSMERKMFWMKHEYVFNVFPELAEKNMMLEIDPKQLLFVFARPCHNGFVERTIKKMQPGSESLYISNLKNTFLDLGDLKFKKLDHKGSSMDKEDVLSIIS